MATLTALVLCAWVSLGEQPRAVAFHRGVPSSWYAEQTVFDLPTDIWRKGEWDQEASAAQSAQFLAGCEATLVAFQPPSGDEWELASEDSPHGVWQYLPRGMVPHFGPRTREADRHSGFGEMLTTTSWLARPLSLGAIGGGMFGTPLIQGRLSQRATTFVGIHYGWDYDHRWGVDKYLGYQPVLVTNSKGDQSRNGHVWFGQYRVLYYPWGDMRWRPYLVSGLGMADLRFQDDQGGRVHRTAFAGSFGIGVKYLLHERWAFQAELSDLILPATGVLSTVNDVALVGGIEYRFALPKRHWRWRRSANTSGTTAPF
ncbi:MAG: porin family protein [Planctomycetes bacterium]|nr:porin family protein [Planctomycetota bacterium]